MVIGFSGMDKIEIRDKIAYATLVQDLEELLTLLRDCGCADCLAVIDGTSILFQSL